MGTETALFNECYNFILAHQYGKGTDAFLAAYQEHPREVVYFYGLFIAQVLKADLAAGLEILAREKDISLHSTILTGIYRFLKGKQILVNARPAIVMYNLGLFFIKQGQYQDAKLFLQTCLLLEPAHTRALAAAGEIAIREQNFSQGLNFYVQAARQAAGLPDKNTKRG